MSPRPALLLLSLALVAPAAPQERDVEPEVGQPGKDVVWVPTPERLVDRMLAMAQVGPGDVVYDLGSGDGRTVIAAAKRGAHAVGVEYEADLVALSRRRAERERLPADRARFVQGDIFEADFTGATVVTLYLLPDLNLRLRPILLAMRPGTRVVSHMFKMEDWEPDETSYLDHVVPAYLWIVPARVQGTWAFALEGAGTFSIDLEQGYQDLHGSVDLGPVRGGLRAPRLKGALFSFDFVDGEGVLHEIDGRATEDGLQGSYQAGSRSGRFTATRTGPKPVVGLR
jgi:SAM-dependent methyltransferase